MGSKKGYEYHYSFSMVEANEINSLYKSKLKPGAKAFLFEVRTDFVLQTRTEEGVISDAIMDSEKFDARIYAQGDEMREAAYLDGGTRYRLREYWMTCDEIDLLLEKAVAFANRMARDPLHATLDLIPVVVHLKVCTVQKEGESSGAAMDRAIKAKYLVPIYLWSCATAVECKRRVTPMLKIFLRDVRKIRVENIDEGLALMQSCHICSRNTTVGAQISSLPNCGHAFHSHCIVGWLEDNYVCPLCNSPAYDRRVLVGPPFMLPRPLPLA